MVAQLVRQDDGSYDYVEVTEPKKPVTSNLTEFESYEGAKKGGENLVSAPSITEQTEKIQREIPGQYKTTFDEKTGQFKTEDVSPITGKSITYTPGEVTPESTEYANYGWNWGCWVRESLCINGTTTKTC